MIRYADGNLGVDPNRSLKGRDLERNREVGDVF